VQEISREEKPIATVGVAGKRFSVLRGKKKKKERFVLFRGRKRRRIRRGSVSGRKVGPTAS